MTNSTFTSAFLKATDTNTVLEIISNIAAHYGVTNKDIYEELEDEDSEALIDYVTIDRQAVSLLINNFKKSL
jgi:hypothetical protein